MKLFDKYRLEINGWDWGAIEAEAGKNLRIDESGCVVGSCFLGSITALFPSGKIYAPWTTNQTARDVYKDEAYLDALEGAAGENGFFIEFESDNVFASVTFDGENEYFTTDDGNTFYRSGERFDDFTAVEAEMEREGFYPGVYWVSDHGNVSVYTNED